MKIYLAGRINKCRPEDVNIWRMVYTKHLEELGHEVIDPAAVVYPDPMTYETAMKIVRKDTEDIRKCDVVIAKYDEPSVGTSMEIMYATSLNIPVLLVTRIPEGELSPWLLANVYYISDDFPEEGLWLIEDESEYFE